MKIYNVQSLYAHYPETSTITISSGWTVVSGTSNPTIYSLTASVPFITSADDPFIQAIGLDTANEIAKWGSIVEAATSSGSITFYSTTSASTSLNLLVKVIR